MPPKCSKRHLPPGRSGALSVSGIRRLSVGVGAMSSKYRVLLVDDEPNLLSSMLGILSGNFEVSTCGSAFDALRMLAPTSKEAVPFHVVCADWQMPGMDGVEFFRQLSNRTEWPSISCILMSARMDELVE